jgi:hypothetical protein
MRKLREGREEYLISLSPEQHDAIRLKWRFTEALEVVVSRAKIGFSVRPRELHQLFVEFAQRLGHTGHLYELDQSGRCPAVCMSSRDFDHDPWEGDREIVALGYGNYFFEEEPLDLFASLRDSPDRDKIIEIAEDLYSRISSEKG